MRKGDDLSVLDAVGVAMVYHGHEYGEISAYGSLKRWCDSNRVC
jgi:hypothetical protein